MDVTLFLNAAAVAAHSNYGPGGFRQRDLRFLLELFLNWTETSITERSRTTIHNTQIQRYLNQLVDTGSAKRLGRAPPPRYRLTRPGLLALVSEITQSPVPAPLEQFHFVHYFVKSYSGRVRELVAEEGAIPHAFEVELQSRLDPENLLRNQMKFVEGEIQKLDRRVHDAAESAQLSESLVRKGIGHHEIADQLERVYPYELNNQKPLSELFRELPTSLRVWELTSGNRQRGQLIFHPLAQILRAHLAALRALQSKT
ncbi:MAG: hypothetical protein NDI61_01275 [Bdellovibrionaceae bacterium]|nr:hypothetical protein [Pseudobdellovibrionaceae bacterium]